MSLSELQQAFINFLVNGDERITHGIVNQGKISTETRLHIYSNAYRQRLRETIDNDHPILGIYLGDELFDRMVAGYIDNYPSNTHSLRYFADQLPTFLQSEPPFCDHPYISELACFERRLLDVFDAPTAEVVTLQQLNAMPHDNWPTIKLRFHPSVHLFKCSWNSVEIWQALKQQKEPPKASSKPNCSWLLWRNPERLSEFASLTQAKVAFLETALGGKNFADMCEVLLEFVDEQDVSLLAVQTLTEWVSAGVVTRLN